MKFCDCDADWTGCLLLLYKITYAHNLVIFWTWHTSVNFTIKNESELLWQLFVRLCSHGIHLNTLPISRLKIQAMYVRLRIMTCQSRSLYLLHIFHIVWPTCRNQPLQTQNYGCSWQCTQNGIILHASIMVKVYSRGHSSMFFTFRALNSIMSDSFFAC
jgi:hypothetical protein